MSPRGSQAVATGAIEVVIKATPASMAKVRLMADLSSRASENIRVGLRWISGAGWW